MFTLLSAVLALLLLWYLQKEAISNMTDEATDWLQDKVLGWMDQPSVNKIDTHHHYVPSFYSKGLSTLNRG